MLEDGSGPGEERWSSVDVVGSQVDAMPMAWPFSVFRDWESNFSSHSPSIAQAWVQSKGVLALHPIKGEDQAASERWLDCHEVR